jgi:hypothetical protein
MFLFIITKIMGQSILVFLSYRMDLPKEWYLLTLVPTTLIGKRDQQLVSTDTH